MVRDGGAELVARVLVAAFSAGVTTISSMGPALLFVVEETSAGTVFLAFRLVPTVAVAVTTGLVAVVVSAVVAAGGGVDLGGMTSVLGDEQCNLFAAELGNFYCHGWVRVECGDGHFADSVPAGRCYGGGLMRRQVDNTLVWYGGSG